MNIELLQRAFTIFEQENVQSVEDMRRTIKKYPFLGEITFTLELLQFIASDDVAPEQASMGLAALQWLQEAQSE